MARKPFVVIDAEILSSSVWSEDPSTRLVWLTMLILCDTDGYVGAAIPGIASAANVTIEQCEAALERLQAPDPYSRTQDYEGRRIKKTERGWSILNFKAHLDRLSRERQKSRERTRRWRDKKRDVTLPPSLRRHGDDNEKGTGTSEQGVENNNPPTPPKGGIRRRRSTTEAERDRLLADTQTRETADDWVEVFGGELGVGLLRAAHRARGAGGYSRETCRSAMDAVRSALDNPESWAPQSSARWCADHKRSPDYVLRPGVVDGLASDRPRRLPEAPQRREDDERERQRVLRRADLRRALVDRLPQREGESHEDYRARIDVEMEREMEVAE